MRFIIDTSVVNTTVRRPNPGDSWDIGDTEGYVSDVFIRRASDWEVSGGHYSHLESSSYMLPEGTNGPVYAVVAGVESGCTFGRTGLEAHVMGVYGTREEAEEGLALMREDSGWYPWSGYFESLESLEVYALIV